MADIVYTVNQDSPENITGFEQYSQEDRALVSSFQINSIFDPANNYSELHILSLSDELLESDYTYTGFTQLGNAQSAGQTGASVLTIDPIADSKAYGYDSGGVKLLYHFLDDLYTTNNTTVEFFIQEISQDRTELVLSTLNLTAEQLTTTTSAIKTKLQSQSYFTGFRLNFKDNDLFIATNIDTLDSGTEKVVVIKLYEPLPTTYSTKSTLNIIDIVSDSIAYEIDAEYILPPEVAPTLRSPNFDLDITDNNVVPTGYYNYNELFSYPVNNTNSQIFSKVNEKGIDISVDYTTFSDFVHFSSAQERLLNFKYKLDLVTSYSASLATIANSTTGLQGVSGSRDYYQNLLTGVVNNFDHYERFLYYESGSSSWPKSNTTKPYINKASTNSEAITWYTNQIANAIKYDNTNYSSLAYSIPTYLRDDANNENYLTFVYMVGQHFDNLWLYSKAVTDKYDADNRIDKGISKDLVAEALKNFGVKLYTSNKSIEDLFTTFIGQAYQSGSEDINVYVTGSLTGSNASIQPTSYDNYQKEVQKRIYHNLPLLLKSKGTERGLRALINCLGIPSDILQIKLYGGRNTNETPFYGDYQYSTSSLNKIRLDNTGSIVTGSTLSNYTSIVKRDDKYTDDLHLIEIGFSPTDNINNVIISASKATASLANFNIDDYLGDARNLTSDRYHTYSSTGVVTSNLVQLTNTILRQAAVTGSYNVQDYVRLIKFFDNTVFKMIKDFIPARAVADTGIIIKPHLLSRNKAKSVILSGSRPEYTGSIDTAFISGSDGDVYSDSTGIVRTGYADTIQTPQGLALSYRHISEEAKFNGELSSSYLRISDKDLNRDNPLKDTKITGENQPVAFYTTMSAFVCALSSPSPLPIIVARNNQTVDVVNDLVDLFYSGVTFKSSSYIAKNTLGQYVFPEVNYTRYAVTASRTGFATPCSSSASYLTQYCDLATTDQLPESVYVGSVANLENWFTRGTNTNARFTASWDNGVTYNTQNIAIPASYTFNQPAGTIVTMSYNDSKITAYTCSQTASILVEAIPTVPVTVLTTPYSRRSYNDVNAFGSSSNESHWDYLIIGGYSYYGGGAAQAVDFRIVVTQQSQFRIKLEWSTETATPQGAIRFYVSSVFLNPYINLDIIIPYGERSAISPIVTLPVSTTNGHSFRQSCGFSYPPNALPAYSGNPLYNFSTSNGTVRASLIYNNN